MSTRTRPLLLLSCAGAMGFAASGVHSPAASCVTRGGGSRWEPSSTRQYRSAEDYGRAKSVFADIQSVAIANDTLYANDVKMPAITVLRPDLKLVRRIDRSAAPQSPMASMLMSASVGRRFLDATDSALYVFDGKVVTALSHSGAPLGNTHLIPTGFAPFSVVGMQSVGANLLFGVDSANPSTEQRRLQIWSTPLKGGTTTRVPFDIELRAATGGVMVIGAGNPRPLWAASGRCLVATDGENEFIVRHSLDAPGSDTIRLPHFDVKQHDVGDDAARASALLGSLRAKMGKTAGGAVPSGGALGVLRWTDMVVDPDGYVWIELWRDPAVPKAPVRVYRVDLASGSVEKDVLPAFPVAFGHPGSYYARATDPTGTLYLARYELAPAR
jgi:hypothetical protein